MFSERVLPRQHVVIIISVVCVLGVVLWVDRAYSQDAAPGPYYFVSDKRTPADQQFYSGGVGTYGGVSVIENYNLLATVLGDTPSTANHPLWRLLPEEDFDFGPEIVRLRPFAYTLLQPGVRPSGKKYNLPIGSKLKAFLDDPLEGSSFDLTLPFRDPKVALSDRSALLRLPADDPVENSGTWHTAVDLDVSGQASQGFDVLAPADGIVEGNNLHSHTLCLKHTASNGKEFLTIYAHMVPASKSHLGVGDVVRRGDVIGRVQEWRMQPDPSSQKMDPNQAYTHLHFGVAVKGPDKVVNGTSVPSLWYLIDPFGVYDYRRNSSSETDYNYLPSDTFDAEVKGIRHAYVWRTNPPIGSLLLQEECLRFNPSKLFVFERGGLVFLATGEDEDDPDKQPVFLFPDLAEANRALSIIQHYRINSSCFLRHPNSNPEFSFQYLLVNDASPQGPLSGEDCTEFNPSGLIIFRSPTVIGFQLGFQLTLRRPGPSLPSSTIGIGINFPTMLEAGNALSVIRKYRFSRSCFVGRPDPSLRYLRN